MDRMRKIVIVSAKLRSYRMDRNMRQKDLADFLGCRRELVNRWELCKALPSRRWLGVMKDRGIEICE